MRWILIGISQHPAARDITSVDAAQVADLNRQVAQLVEELLIQDCRRETGDAMDYEGELALEEAFAILGEVAFVEVSGDANVAQAMMGFTNYLDPLAFEEAFGPWQ